MVKNEHHRGGVCPEHNHSGSTLLQRRLFRESSCPKNYVAEAGFKDKTETEKLAECGFAPVLAQDTGVSTCECLPRNGQVHGIRQSAHWWGWSKPKWQNKCGSITETRWLTLMSSERSEGWNQHSVGQDTQAVVTWRWWAPACFKDDQGRRPRSGLTGRPHLVGGHQRTRAFEEKGTSMYTRNKTASNYIIRTITE